MLTLVVSVAGRYSVRCREFIIIINSKCAANYIMINSDVFKNLLI